MTVSAVVVSHGHARELEESLPALAPQVDELVVIANLPGSVGELPAGTRAREPSPEDVRGERERRRGGHDRRVRARLESGRGARAGRGRCARSLRGRAPTRRFRRSRVVFWPDGTWQPSLRRFPDVLGTSWRRTPLRLLRRPYEHQTSHYGTRPAEPVQGDWLLGGACLLMRRSMLEEIGGWDGGFRHYVEDIDVAYRAAQAGWSAGSSPKHRPPRVRRRDRQALPQPAHALAPAWEWRGSCASTRNGSARCDQGPTSTRAAPRRWTETQYASAARLSRAPRRPRRLARAASRARRCRARSRLRRRRSRRPPSRARSWLPRRRLHARDGRRGERTPRRPCGGGARRPERLRAARAGGGDDLLPARSTTRGDRKQRSSLTSPDTRNGSSSSTSIRGSTGSRTSSRISGAAGFARDRPAPFFSAAARRAAWAAGNVLQLAERAGPLARLALRFRFSYLCAASVATRAIRAG